MLHRYGKQLESGKISEEDLVNMTDASRDLYERLIVLRHKAFEQMVHEEETIEEQTEEITPPKEEEVREMPEPVMVEKPDDEVNELKEPEPEEEVRPIIPIGGAEVSPNQISLIDSIEEIKQMEQSINDRFKESGSEKSLAQTLQHKTVEDLSSSIGINQKFRFISQLFKEDKEAFDTSIDRLNTFNSYLEADEFIHNTLSEQYGWDDKDPVVKELVELTKRRYL